jgi:MFS family permease
MAATTGPYWESILPLVLAGIGVSMVLPVAPAAVLSAVGPADIGRASAVNNMLQRFGSAFGVAVVTAVFLANGNLTDASSFNAGLAPALVAAAGLSVLGALSALVVRQQRVQEHPVPSARRVPDAATVRAADLSSAA